MAKDHASNGYKYLAPRQLGCIGVRRLNYSEQKAELLSHHNDASKEVLIALYNYSSLAASQRARDRYTHMQYNHTLATPINLTHN